MKELLEKLLPKLDMMKVVVGLVTMGVFTFVSWMVITTELPSGNKEIAINLIGLIEGLMLSIVNFYYGSSKGSHDKNEILKDKMP